MFKPLFMIFSKKAWKDARSRALTRFSREKQKNAIIKEFLLQQAAFYGGSQDLEQINYDLFGKDIFANERKH